MDIRLNKLLSDAGVCSRREADEFIETDRVTVNGKLPKMGQRVAADDVVLVDGEKPALPEDAQSTFITDEQEVIAQYPGVVELD